MRGLVLRGLASGLHARRTRRGVRTSAHCISACEFTIVLYACAQTPTGRARPDRSRSRARKRESAHAAAAQAPLVATLADEPEDYLKAAAAWSIGQARPQHPVPAWQRAAAHMFAPRHWFSAPRQPASLAGARAPKRAPSPAGQPCGAARRAGGAAHARARARGGRRRRSARAGGGRGGRGRERGPARQVPQGAQAGRQPPHAPARARCARAAACPPSHPADGPVGTTSVGSLMRLPTLDALAPRWACAKAVGQQDRSDAACACCHGIPRLKDAL